MVSHNRFRLAAVSFCGAGGGILLPKSVSAGRFQNPNRLGFWRRCAIAALTRIQVRPAVGACAVVAHMFLSLSAMLARKTTAHRPSGWSLGHSDGMYQAHSGPMHHASVDSGNIFNNGQNFDSFMGCPPSLLLQFQYSRTGLTGSCEIRRHNLRRSGGQTLHQSFQHP